jgi:hypothetical protein
MLKTNCSPIPRGTNLDSHTTVKMKKAMRGLPSWLLMMNPVMKTTRGIRHPLKIQTAIVMVVIGIALCLLGCSAPAATQPPVSDEPPIPQYTFATLDTVAALAQFDSIPELRVYLQDSDTVALEGQVRELFGGKGYTLTVEERSGAILVLQFERDSSVYAVRIAPLPDASGQSLQILPTSAALAFNDTAQNEGVPASFWNLILGDCVLAKDATQTLEKIGCDQPHFGEVVGAWNLPNDNVPFPGDAVWINIYTYECAAAFESYTGDVPNGDHDYWYSGFGPTPASWAVGDRAVLCLLFHADGVALDHSARDEFK